VTQALAGWPGSDAGGVTRPRAGQRECGRGNAIVVG